MGRYDICGMTHAGLKGYNEDAYTIVEIGNVCLLAVADGVGGCAGGERAARIAIETVSSSFTRRCHEGMDAEDVADLLYNAFHEADRRIRAEQHRYGKMGTTLVAAVISGRRVVIANCGDSRAFIAGKTIVFRTQEHSFVNTLLQSGSIRPEEAEDHPLRSVITHALGVNVRVDLYEEELGRERVLVLASDGLSGRTAAEICAGDLSLTSEELTRRLMEGALLTGDDDVTVVSFRDRALFFT
ncbi:PP2C family protein-serine/threonine phosphatase [Methanofollis fontis]|nr:protein phosphatase 2C domain-containing protein [Methanofollis fontis]